MPSNTSERSGSKSSARLASRLNDEAVTTPAFKTLLAIFLAAFIARLLFFAWHGAIIAPDTGGYVQLARNIIDHFAFSLDTAPPLMPTIRRSPLYPAFLALLGGGTSNFLVVIVQAALDALVAVLVLLIARAVVPLTLAVVAALLFALHPGEIVAACSLLSEEIFTFMLVSGVWLTSAGLARDRLRLSAAGGVFFGLAVLCRPLGFFIPLIFAVAACLMLSLPRVRRHSLILVLCFIVVLVPWLVRCAVVSGDFVLVQGYSGANFYVATRYDLSQQDESKLWPSLFGEGTQDPYGQILRNARTPHEAVATDRAAFRLGWKNILANPRAYLKSRANAYPHLFLTSFDEFTDLNNSFAELRASRAFLSMAAKLGLLFLFSLLPLALGLAGLIWTRKQPSALLCAVCWVYTLFVYLPLWIEYRFWKPAVPFLLVSAALGLQGILDWARHVTGSRGQQWRRAGRD